MTDRDADTDSLTRAFDQNREHVESFVDRLDTADELLGTALRSARALRGDADTPVRERPAESGPTPNPSTDPNTPDAAGSAGVAPDDPTVHLAGAVGADGDDVAAAVETAAELHREGALSDVTDAVSKEDVARGVEAFLDAYADPKVEGTTGYLVAVANGLADRDAREEE